MARGRQPVIVGAGRASIALCHAVAAPYALIRHCHGGCRPAGSRFVEPVHKRDEWVPLRVGAETYAAFRSVVSTAKANGASVLDTVRFVLSDRWPANVLAWVG